MTNITFLGGGSFGTSLAILLADNKNKVNIYDRDNDVVKDINENRKNDKYIKNLIIPQNVTAYNDLNLAIKDAEFIVLAVLPCY